ncbi:MAG: DHA2 family efflux MFS transporter permease subunit [Rhodospirillaceae bacterium]
MSGLLGAVAMILSATVVNVAVPSFMGAFGIGQTVAQWASTTFITSMVASQLISVWVVAHLGQRNAYAMTLVLFAAGAFVCALAPNMDTLIIGRIMQGISAGIVQPLVLSTIIAVFPIERRGFAVSMYSVGVTLAPSFGPVVGGVIVDALTWRHIFIVPLPLAFIAFVLGLSFMPQERQKGPKPPFDWTGLVLVVTFCFSVMSGLANGQRWGWHSNEVLVLLVGGIAAGIVFLWHQMRSKNPMLDVNLFTNPAFASAMVIAFLFGAGNFATNYAIPVFTQQVQGFTATAAGMVLVPAGIFLLLITPVAGRLNDHVSPRYPISAGVLIFVIAALIIAKSDVNTAFLVMVLLTVLSRLAIGLVMPAMGAAAIRAVPEPKINAGAATYNFVRQLGGAFGTLIFVVITEQRTAFHADAMAATQTSANPLSREFLSAVGRVLGESGVPDTQQTAGALDFLAKVIHAQATTLGFQDAFIVSALVFSTALIPAWILGRTTKMSK